MGSTAPSGALSHRLSVAWGFRGENTARCIGKSPPRPTGPPASSAAPERGREIPVCTPHEPPPCRPDRRCAAGVRAAARLRRQGAEIFPALPLPRVHEVPESPGPLFRQVLKQRSCAPGTPDCDLLIVPEPDDLVFDKDSYGLCPRHLRQLEARGIRRITVCGLDTDACVMGVMFSLFDAGIVCHLKEEMCWSSSGLHSAAMRIVRKQFPETR